VDPKLEPQYFFLKNNRTETGVNWWVRIHSQSVRIRSEQRLISETELELDFKKKPDPVPDSWLNLYVEPNSRPFQFVFQNWSHRTALHWS
jgi:hypothetical protein